MLVYSRVPKACETLPVRLMVGLWFLVPTIGVRVPDRQLIQKKQAFACFFCMSADPGHGREKVVDILRVKRSKISYNLN